MGNRSRSANPTFLGVRLAEGQVNPQVLLISDDSIRHVAPYWIDVERRGVGRRVRKGDNNCERDLLLADTLRKESGIGFPCGAWWASQVEAGKVIVETNGGHNDKQRRTAKADDAVDDQESIVLHGRYHFHEQAVYIQSDCPSSAVSIVYNDGTYLAATKPQGVDTLCNPAAGRVRNSFPGLLAQMGFPDALPAHRIDNPVSGLVCCGRNVSASKRLGRCIERREARKSYLARVQMINVQNRKEEIQCSLPPLPMEIDHPLSFDRDRSLAFIDHDRGASAITTVLKVLGTCEMDRTAVVVVQPQTGRKHQIRCHLAAAGIPIANDGKYGGASLESPSAFGIDKEGAQSPPELQHLLSGNFDNRCEACSFYCRVATGRMGLGPKTASRIWLHSRKYEFPTLGISFEAPKPRWATDVVAEDAWGT